MIVDFFCTPEKVDPKGKEDGQGCAAKTDREHAIPGSDGTLASLQVYPGVSTVSGIYIPGFKCTVLG